MKEDEEMSLNSSEQALLTAIKKTTDKLNIDNISRTQAYATFYHRYPEVKWAFLASMVSRNAGWNMCDLQGKNMKKALSKQTRDLLFLTYERANWLIFKDAFPQLLLYAVSRKKHVSYIHLLPYLNVSSFIEEKWRQFMRKPCELQLIHALVVNEQHVIQQPVIEQPFYQDRVFKSTLFFFQDIFHFSSVLFPTTKGELYGCSVHDFTKVNNRIDLGKKLAALLFHEKYYPLFYEFSLKTKHTGSRYDYEQYFVNETICRTPALRKVYPAIRHHEKKREEWFLTKKEEQKLMKKPSFPKKVHFTKWYLQKQKQLYILMKVAQVFNVNKNGHK